MTCYVVHLQCSTVLMYSIVECKHIMKFVNVLLQWFCSEGGL